MENEFIENNHEIEVHCWNCSKVFYIKKQNTFVGELFCSDKCRKEDYEKWLVIKGG